MESATRGCAEHGQQVVRKEIQMTKNLLAVTDQKFTELADDTDGPVFVHMTKEEILAEIADFDMPDKDDNKTMTPQEIAGLPHRLE